MALAGTNASVPLLLAYCITGLALWTIDTGIGQRSTRKVFGSGPSGVVSHERTRTAKLENYVKPLLGRSGQAQLQSWPRATGAEPVSVNDPFAKTEAMNQQRRRTMMTLMVMALLEGPNVKSE